MPPAELQAFMDEFNHQIFNLASSADINDKKGAILATGERGATGLPADVRRLTDSAGWWGCIARVEGARGT